MSAFSSKIAAIVTLGCVSATQLMAQDARPAYEADKIFVKLQNSVNWKLPEFKTANEVSKLESLPEFQRIAQAHGINYVVHPFKTRSEELDRTYEVRFSDKEHIDDVLKEISQLSYVEYAEKMPIYYIDYNPNDYIATLQYYINKIKANLAWDVTKGDTAITIAIVDNAVFKNHPDLAPNIFINTREIPNNNADDDGNGFVDDVQGWDAGDGDNDVTPPFASTGGIDFTHGTHVAGCASAQADNGLGVAGPGFNCSIIPVKCKSSTDTDPNSVGNAYVGVDYAISCGLSRVINMSFGGTGYSQTNQNLFTAGHNQGIVLVASAGNDNVTTAHYPSGYNHVISVAATNTGDGKASFSNYNASVDVCAPGTSIRATYFTGNYPNLTPSYSSLDGTSMSGPIVAGVIGLMLSVNPCLSPDSVEYYLKATCVNIDAIPVNVPYAGMLGAGRINAQDAVNAVLPTATPTAAFTSSTIACTSLATFEYTGTTPVSCGTTFTWDFGDGTQSVGNTITHSYPGPGTYNVTLTVTNTAGSNSTTNPVTITAGQAVTVNAGPDLTTCPTVGVQLNPTVTGTYTSLSWSPISGLSNPNILNPIATPNTTTTYTLTLSNASGCSASDAVKVQITAPPQIYAGADVSKAAGTDITLNATGLGGTSYSWSPTTELLTPNAQSTICQATSTRTYTVTLTSAGGCSKSDALLVTVWPVGIEDAQVGTLGAVVPNPIATTASLKANFEQAGNLRIRLFDAMGRQVQDIYEGNVIPGDFFLSFERKAELAAGMYMIAWELNGKITTQKVQLN